MGFEMRIFPKAIFPSCDYVVEVDVTKFGVADSFSENDKQLFSDLAANGSITKVCKMEVAYPHTTRRFESSRLMC